MKTTQIEIMKRIEKAKRVVVVSAVAFDLWNNLANAQWFKDKIKNGDLTFEIFCEAPYIQNSQALISEIPEINNQDIALYGEYISKIDEVYTLRKELKEYGCTTLEPVDDQIQDVVDEKLKLYEKSLWDDADKNATISFGRDGSEIKSYSIDVVEKIKVSVKQKKKELENYYRDNNDFKYCFILRTCYTAFTIPAIKIVLDNGTIEYYYSLSLTRFINVKDFIKSTDLKPSDWHSEIKDYFAYFESDKGGKKYSTEFTKNRDKLEVIQSYTNNGEDNGREPLHLLPRKSFLETPQQKKLVVWGFIFTRDGRMLIHQRGKNASDNQGLWDKSVGGHVAPHDIDTAKALAREMAEELYTHEMATQGGHGIKDFIKTNEDKMIFLGEWQTDPEKRINLNDIISSKRDEYYYFRFEYGFSKKSHLSPRLLPSGQKQDVDAFVDVFVGIVSDKFDIDKLSHNSKYMLKTPKEISTMINMGKFKNKNGEYEEFKVSPDIDEMRKEGLWDKLIGFSEYLAKQLN